MNERQIILNIKNLISSNPNKGLELERVQAITEHLTSDDGCWVDIELYDDNIVRYIINGTRAKMTLTVNALSHQLTRKPRCKKPWQATFIQCSISDLL